MSVSSIATNKSRRNKGSKFEQKLSSNNSPDSGFINTLRYGMLAVRLLPRSSISS